MLRPPSGFRTRMPRSTRGKISRRAVPCEHLARAATQWLRRQAHDDEICCTDERLFAWHASLFPTGSDIHAKPPGDRGPDLSGVEFLALYFTALEDIFCERLKDRLLAEVKSESFHVADQPALLVSDRSERFGVSRSRFQ